MKPFDGKYQNVWNKYIIHLTPSSTISEILAFNFFYFENLGRCRAIQYSQWRQSMANINLYKSHSTNFYANSRRFQDIPFRMFDLENLGQGNRVQHSPFDGECQPVLRQQAGSYRFRYINVWKWWHRKWMSRSRLPFAQWCHSVANFNFYKSHTMHFRLAITVFEILTIQMFDRENLGKGHRVQHS